MKLKKNNSDDIKEVKDKKVFFKRFKKNVDKENKNEKDSKTNNKEKRSLINIFKKNDSKKKSRFSIFKDEEKVSYSFKEVIIIMLFSLGLGFLSCLSFVKIFNGGRDYKALSKDLSKFVDTYYAIKDNYYGELDNNLLVESAIKGMIEAVGDDYTSYSDIEDTDDFMQTVSGVYEGIGCTVGMDEDGHIIVMDMFEDSPSMKAGIKIGDIIVKVDGNDYTNKTSTDMSNYIKNNDSSKVTLTILRDDNEFDITIKREKIEMPYVTGKVIEKNNKKVGYINITLFSSVADSQFKKELEKLEKDGIESLIIDVRGNSGGYLTSVTGILNMLLKKGDIIYQLEDDNGTKIKKDDTKEKRDYPIAVLVNGGSASASEILASAIKESYNGFIVGTNTYGKGTVQQTKKLSDGSMVKYTIQKWLTPDGNWINDVGVTPTDEVVLNMEYMDNPTDENDNQLQKALELVIK